MGDRMDSTTETQYSSSDRSNGALDATGAYETADGVVLYDTENALAWVQSDSAVPVTEML